MSDSVGRQINFRYLGKQRDAAREQWGFRVTPH